MTVNVLSAEYEIIKKKYAEDEAFERRSIAGYCDNYMKQIVYCDMSTYKGWEHEDKKTVFECEKELLRHEITHAFLIESGLDNSSLVYDRPWAGNEEMVDWIALQGMKVYKAWQEVGAI